MRVLAMMKHWLGLATRADSENLTREVREHVHDQRNFAAGAIAQQGQQRQKLDHVLTTARNAVATLERAKRRRDRQSLR